MFIREIVRTTDWGEYDVDVVTPIDKGREDLAEAIEAQGDITWIFFYTSINPHTLFKS